MQPAAERADQRDRRGLADPPRRRHLLEAEGAQVDEVDQGIEHHHDDRAPHQPEGQGALRVPHLARREGRAVPAVVGPQRGDHGDPDPGEEGHVGQRPEQGHRPPRLDREGQDRERDDRADPEHGQEVLHPGALAQADVVDGGQHQDGERGRHLAARQRPGPRAHRHRQQDVVHREEGREAAQVLAEGDRDRGDAARHDDQEGGPPEEEAPEAAIGLPEVEVDAAGAREHRPELGVGEGAGQGEEPGQRPHHEDHPLVGQDPGDVGGGDEDAGADHRADGEEGGVPAAEAAQEALRAQLLARVRARAGSARRAHGPGTREAARRVASVAARRRSVNTPSWRRASAQLPDSAASRTPGSDIAA